MSSAENNSGADPENNIKDMDVDGNTETVIRDSNGGEKNDTERLGSENLLKDGNAG